MYKQSQMIMAKGEKRQVTEGFFETYMESIKDVPLDKRIAAPLEAAIKSHKQLAKIPPFNLSEETKPHESSEPPLSEEDLKKLTEKYTPQENK